MMKRMICLLMALLLGCAPFALAEEAEFEFYAVQPVLDSIMRAGGEGASGYDPANPEYVWVVLYLCGVNFGLEYEDVVMDDDTGMFGLSNELVWAFAACAFPGMAELPEGAEMYGMEFDIENNQWLMPGSDMGDSYTELGAVEFMEDGRMRVTVNMMDYEQTLLDSTSFVLVPAEEGAMFPYGVESVE